MSYRSELAFQWKAANATDDVLEMANVVDSDRLLEWDFDKHERLRQQVFGNTWQTWYQDKPEQIEGFLSLYFEKQVRLVAVSEPKRHLGNGFPVWSFFYQNI